MLTPNSTLQNRYHIVRELGHGGMGTVYEAIDERLSCVVALKQALVGANHPAREAFQREAALLANLRHASLPKVMDYFSEGDGEFLVMEFITGRDLADLLEQQQAPFPPDQVLAWADEILKLLDYLHTRQPPIVHRDIKPANLKVTSEGEIFLLDFGLAKGAAGQMATVRTDGSVHGYTPLYAPLEQIHGQGTDPRTDIYSLGATLYDLLAGQPPVAAPVRFEAIENERPDPLLPVNRLNSRVPLVIAEVIQNAMALSRRNRFSSAAEMRNALQRAKQTLADVEAARAAAERALDKKRADAQIDPDKPLIADSNVEFTVYSPRQIKPEKNYTMLAFAHLARKRDDAPADEPDPIEEMKEQAARILGKQQADYDDVKESAGQPVPREGEITFAPVVPGITFSPAQRTFTWRKSVHREEFDLWAAPDLDGKNLSGQMTVFLGSLVIAEVPLKISVNSRAESAAEKISLDGPQSSRRLRQIFASYSHQDEEVVAELAQVAPLFGSRFVLDRTHLEPGEDRREGLQRLIRGADMFQLFWSTNAMRSADTVDEINYAVSLERPGFILPTYWEEPLPRSPADELPPPAIDRLQFHRIYPQAISKVKFGDQAETGLVVMGPIGAEVFFDDERHGSFGSSGRLIVKSLRPGRHVLRISRAGDQDDERVIEIQAGAEEQIIQAQFKSDPAVSPSAAPGMFSMAPQSEPGLCPRCGSNLAGGRFCGHCGYVPRPNEALSTVGDSRDTGAKEAGGPAAHEVMAWPAAAQIVQCTRCKARFAEGIIFCGRCGNTSFEPATERAQPSESAGASFRGEPIGAAYTGPESSAPFASFDEADDVAKTGALPPIQDEVADTAPLELPQTEWASPVEPRQSPPVTSPSYDRRSPTAGGMGPTESPATAADFGAGGPLLAVVFCAACGMKLAPDIKFCPHCGSDRRRPVAITQPLSPPAPAMAPTGRPQPVETIGSPPLTMATEFSPVTPVPAVAKRKFPMMPIYAGAAMLLLVVILAPAWFIMSGNRTGSVANSNKSVNTNPTSTSGPPKSFTNSIGMQFVYVPSGTFMMGSNNDDPVHQVTITKPFYLAKYELTQGQWQAVMGNNPSRYKGNTSPVDQVSWNDAIAFIAKLNSRNDGFTYRLPTEAEWEYAARAGTTSTYYWGNDQSQACRYANVGDQSAKEKYPNVELIACRDGYADSSPVGSFQPNSFELYDMIGNVGEWCQDWYDANYYGTSPGSDPQGPASGQTRVLRGGTFGQATWMLGSATRFQSSPELVASNFGFRVAAMKTQ